MKCFFIFYFVWRTLTLNKQFQCKMILLWNYRQMPIFPWRDRSRPWLGCMSKRQKRVWSRNTSMAQCGAIRNSGSELYRFVEKSYKTRDWK